MTHTQAPQSCLLGQPDTEFPSPRHHTPYPGLRNGSKGQSLLPAPQTRWKGGQSAALSPCHGAVAGGDTCWGGTVYSPGLGFFSLLAAGNGNVSFLKALSVLSRALPWLIGCVLAGGQMHVEVKLLLEFRLKAALAGIQPGSEFGDPQGQDQGCLNAARVHSCAERSWGQMQFLSRKRRFTSQKLVGRTCSFVV